MYKCNQFFVICINIRIRNSLLSMAKSIKIPFLTCSGILITCILAISLQIILFSPISPGLVEPLPPSFTLSGLSNGKLQEVTKLGEGLLKQPEDVAIDKLGILYTATRDGCIQRLHKNGTWDTWWQIDSDSLLGLITTEAGDLIVCDANKVIIN
ncbi:hypothetical protein ACJIZ3_021468 [Penstemon smallii]|uniref:Uncharacterized protein n=1 Tax=Penstemon smallii TaxID=265156 RepID=A0ABD3SLI6_9LAMI